MSTEPPVRFTARELAAQCGVSERTVRFYVQAGLLPPPASRGRGAHFGTQHHTRLKLIRAMQQAGNDLDAIGDYLKALERKLKQNGASFEDALAIWSGRMEQAAWAETRRRLGSQPEPTNRYRLAEGVELLVDVRAGVSPARMRELLRLLRRELAED
jgi:DNA-binding transcriptional MerR regulator